MPKCKLCGVDHLRATTATEDASRPSGTDPGTSDRLVYHDGSHVACLWVADCSNAAQGALVLAPGKLVPACQACADQIAEARRRDAQGDLGRAG